MQQFEDFRATALYCSQCGQSTPVRERLLLILPDGNLFEYICTMCGSTVGEKKTRLSDEDKRLF
jgi:DNA-directed RNA polymerase subunit RPC12/RpoP